MTSQVRLTLRGTTNSYSHQKLLDSHTPSTLWKYRIAILLEIILYGYYCFGLELNQERKKMLSTDEMYYAHSPELLYSDIEGVVDESSTDSWTHDEFLDMATTSPPQTVNIYFSSIAFNNLIITTTSRTNCHIFYKIIF